MLKCSTRRSFLTLTNLAPFSHFWLVKWAALFAELGEMVAKAALAASLA
jgi:hypothetical protein